MGLTSRPSAQRNPLLNKAFSTAGYSKLVTLELLPFEGCTSALASSRWYTDPADVPGVRQRLPPSDLEDDPDDIELIEEPVC